MVTTQTLRHGYLLILLLFVLSFPFVTNCKKTRKVIAKAEQLIFYQDKDADGFGSQVTKVAQIQDFPEGFTTQSGDCDDNDKNINPSAKEVCNEKDDNCNSEVDEEVLKIFFKDSDSDGYTDGSTKPACSPLQGYTESATSGDCDDADPTMSPSVTETCDNKDNNCNGQIDENLKSTFYEDADQDLYGNPNSVTQACSQPTGYVSDNQDCDDQNANINPKATELCDNVDNNCNGQIDEGFNVGQNCSAGFGECARTGVFVCKQDGSGTQCNATPGTPTTEICDGKDNDCDGLTDEGVSNA